MKDVPIIWSFMHPLTWRKSLPHPPLLIWFWGCYITELECPIFLFLRCWNWKSECPCCETRRSTEEWQGIKLRQWSHLVWGGPTWPFNKQDNLVFGKPYKHPMKYRTLFQVFKKDKHSTMATKDIIMREKMSTRLPQVEGQFIPFWFH